MEDLVPAEQNNSKEFSEILYQIKHILGVLPKHTRICAFILCFATDHRNYKGDFINDTVVKLVTQYHNVMKPKFNWNWD